MTTHVFQGELFPWREDQPDSWVFVALPEDVSDRIDDELTDPPRGFGSVRVEVTVGESTWSTSLFPSKEQGTYVLPVKKPVRRAERIDAGDTARFAVEVVE